MDGMRQKEEIGSFRSWMTKSGFREFDLEHFRPVMPQASESEAEDFLFL